jgi:DNA-binding Xre family transcriptional regulator
MKTNKIELSTFEKFMQDPKQKKLFDKEYNQFLLKEFLLEAMDENKISVRKLSEQSGVSTSIIQNIRSEKTSNVTFNTLNSLMTTLGYRIIIEKDEKIKKKKSIAGVMG